MSGMQRIDLDGFSGRLPIFPLPDLTFFPCTLLPLNIFEPRYRQMVREASGPSGEGFIGMVKLDGDWQQLAPADRRTHETACLGKIVECKELPDGRFHLVLCGVKRVQIERFERLAPYRIAKVALLDDRTLLGRERESEALLQLLIRRVEALPPGLLKHKKLALALRRLEAPLGCATDLCADSLLVAPSVKQALLESTDPILRAERLISAIDDELTLCAGLRARTSHGGPP
ncbi:MAG: LON peptidase substrate-binding domain-containing protein, partial [Planctomycetota bacterium]